MSNKNEPSYQLQHDYLVGKKYTDGLTSAEEKEIAELETATAALVSGYLSIQGAIDTIDDIFPNGGIVRYTLRKDE